MNDLLTSPAIEPIPASNAESPPVLAFVATEDWFFASHFLPMARAAVAMGLDVLVIGRVKAHRQVIEATGAGVIGVEWNRGSLNPLHLWRDARLVAAILRQNRVDLVHAIALRGILIAGIAAWKAGIRKRILAVTGLGFIGASAGLKGHLMRTGIKWLLRAFGGSQTVYLFENEDDPKALGLGRKARIATVGGAGIDPELLPATSPPSPHEPLRIAIVSRMLWSKGIDLAVAAIGKARAAGADVTLSLFGAPDPDNPRSIGEATLKAWASQPGVSWHGPIGDVASVWREHHLCCVPSRGGEGLPRTMLEAAACGRGIVTTDVPGCRRFVRDGQEGIVVRPDDADALATAFIAIAADPQKVAAFGAAARERVLNGFTQTDVARTVSDLYRTLLAEK